MTFSVKITFILTICTSTWAIDHSQLLLLNYFLLFPSFDLFLLLSHLLWFYIKFYGYFNHCPTDAHSTYLSTWLIYYYWFNLLHINFKTHTHRVIVLYGQYYSNMPKCLLFQLLFIPPCIVKIPFIMIVLMSEQ